MLFKPTGGSGQERDGDGPPWFSPGRFALLLALLIIAAFPQVVFGIRAFVYRDFGLFAYPLAFHYRESLWHGELPLWNPYNNCGLPFLAQWNAMVLYPFSLLYLFFPLPWAVSLFCLGHLWLAGVTMYSLAYRWTNHRLAAAVAGLAFSWNGLLLNSLMWTNNIAALAWMPAVVGTAERAGEQGGRRIVTAALTGAVQMLSGAPEIILLTWVIISVLWACQWWNGRAGLRPAAGASGPSSSLVLQQAAVGHHGKSETQPTRPLRFRFLLRWASVILLVTGLCSIQLLPFLDLLRHSQRTVELSAARWSMPAWGWANFLVPLFRTDPAPSGVAFQAGQAWTSSYYVSVAVWALALGGLRHARSARVWVLAAFLVIGLLLALGDHGLLFRWVRQAFPWANFMRFPIKFVALTTFTLPLLAAFGLGGSARESGPDKPRSHRSLLGVSAVLLLGIAAIVAWAYFRPLDEQDARTTLKSGLLRGLFLALIFGCLCSWTRMSKARARSLLGLAILGLLWLDVLTHAPWQNPSVPPTVYTPGLLTEQQMPARPQLGRSRALLTFEAMESFYKTGLADEAQGFLLKRLWLFENCNLMERLAKVDGFFSLFLAEERDVHFRLFAADNVIRPRLCDFLGVSHVTGQPGSFSWIYRDTHLPLITIGQQPVFLDAASTLTNLMSPRFSPREEVFLPLEVKPLVPAARATSGQVLTQVFSAHRIHLKVRAEEPSLVTLAQVHYHPWKAYLNGQPVRIWRANHAFQAVAVPVGEHELELRYEDAVFTWGAVTSALSLVLCGTLWWAMRDEAVLKPFGST